MIPEKIKKILEDFNRCKTEAQFEAIMSKIDLQRDELQQYIMFDDRFYTRNLIYKSKHYELLVLCWSKGQRSLPHDHNGQMCWLKVISGQMHEVRFNPKIKSVQEMLATPISAHLIPSGTVSYIHDKIAYHRLGQQGREPAITLHLYSKPIERCQVFVSQTKAPKLKILTYFSQDGVKLSTKTVAQPMFD